MQNSYYKYLYELQNLGTDQASYIEEVSKQSDIETKGSDAKEDIDSSILDEYDQGIKLQITRSRLLAKEDCFYLCIGIFGAVLTGLTFPLTGVRLCC